MLLRKVPGSGGVNHSATPPAQQERETRMARGAAPNSENPGAGHATVVREAGVPPSVPREPTQHCPSHPMEEQPWRGAQCSSDAGGYRRAAAVNLGARSECRHWLATSTPSLAIRTTLEGRIATTKACREDLRSPASIWDRPSAQANAKTAHKQRASVGGRGGKGQPHLGHR